MGFVPDITCRHCGSKYSALHSRCPRCGTRRVKRSSRAPATSASVREGTAAAARAGANTQFQLIFGIILVVAVIIAVIVLISASINGTNEIPDRSPTPPSDVSTPPISPSTPTIPPATPSPTPAATSISITAYGQPLFAEGEFSCQVGDTVDLDATVYPLELGYVAEWTSVNESICTVDSNGVVTAVASGTGAVVARCGAIEVEIIVRVS